jgi:hypothetical protein
MRDRIEIGGKTYNLEIDENNFAYDGESLREVFKTKESVMVMNCIGSMRFVFNENGDILAESYPLMNFNNNFSLISLGDIEKFKKINKEFEKIKKENK